MIFFYTWWIARSFWSSHRLFEYVHRQTQKNHIFLYSCHFSCCGFFFIFISKRVACSVHRIVCTFFFANFITIHIISHILIKSLRAWKIDFYLNRSMHYQYIEVNVLFFFASIFFLHVILIDHENCYWIEYTNERSSQDENRTINFVIECKSKSKSGTTHTKKNVSKRIHFSTFMHIILSIFDMV